VTRPQDAKLQLGLEPVSLLLPKVRRERLPTNTTTRNHAVHRWFNFIAGFSPEFVSECVDALPKSRRTALLDPFTGCGTALVEALRCGMTATGYEPHPVFARIARAKTSNKNIFDRLNRISATIREGLVAPCNPACLGDKPAEFLQKLFERNSLSALIGARNALKRDSLIDDDLAFLILSKCSNLRPILRRMESTKHPLQRNAPETQKKRLTQFYP
jgi:hypothetical protein